MLIGGGYASGREIVEFFLSQGVMGGAIALFAATILFGVVLALAFELARIHRAYDYQSFTVALLGRYWWLFEICYLTIVILVLSVVASAAGTVLGARLTISATVGTSIFVLAATALLLVERSRLALLFSFWSFLLYLAYITLLVLSIRTPASYDPIAISQPAHILPSLASAFLYAGYNLATIPTVLFVLRAHTSRMQALVSGLLAGPIALIPGALLFIVMARHYPMILQEEVPLTYLLAQIASPGFELAIEIVILGTFLQTAVGLIHSFNERVDHAARLRARTLPFAGRAAIALALLIFSTFVAARLSLIDLIAHGYGTLTYAFLALFVLPVILLGTAALLRRPAEARSE